MRGSYHCVGENDDFRSPLKCIRNCIDKPDFGTDKSPVEVEDLMFWLLERLEGLCTERAHAAFAARDGPAAGAAPGDREAAQTILEALRYRLTRLPWRLNGADGQPAVNTVTGYYEPLVRASRFGSRLAY
eukprot:scaffold39.g4415.t1